ncbi:MAG: hypothetical protein IH905_15350 [Proteobacteria bacterium]|nr:hypothetical protein [Pseudomonadota bacterium]
MPQTAQPKTAQTRFKSALTGPISTKEPTFLHDVDMDRMVGAFVALCGEVYIMRDRLRTLEAALEKAGAIAAGAVEDHEEDSEAAAANAADASAFVARVFTELHRSDVPISHIGRAVRELTRTETDDK